LPGIIERVLECRGVPKGFLFSTLHHFPESVKKSFDQDSGYFLFGPCGVGKTHLAVGMMRHIILQKSPDAYRIADIIRGIYDAEFIPVTSLLLRIKKTFSPDAAESEGDVIDRVASRKLLVLDDLGTEKVTEWVLQTLYTIIDIRSRERLQTIITSNFSLDEIKDRLSDRISSRIIGMCKVLPMVGDDKRIDYKQYAANDK
jgi:DNA replication protein DnaC